MAGGAPQGNHNGAKGKAWRDALHKALARYVDADRKIQAGQALDALAVQVVRAALNGNWDAVQEIGNRLDGKPAQTIDANFDAGAGLLAVLTGISKSDDPPVA